MCPVHSSCELIVAFAVQLKMMMGLLEDEDPALHKHLVEQQVDPEFFALKWFGTLFTQTLVLPDLIRFWDTMFCTDHGHRQEYFVAATVACVLLANNDGLLLYSEFPNILRNLQRNLTITDADKFARLAHLVFCKHSREIHMYPI